MTKGIHCSGCKKPRPPDAFALDAARSTGRRYKCRACSSAEFARWKATPGYKARLDKQTAQRRALKASDPRLRWAHVAFSGTKRRAKAKGLAFTLTKDWLRSAAVDTCPLLGIPLVYSNSASMSDSAAVDRKDSAKGYTPDNCWVVSMLANRIKTNATLEQIELLAYNLRQYAA